MKIITSATRITLLLLVITLCVGLFTRVVQEDTFKTALLMVMAFYFGKGVSKDIETPQE